MTEQENTGGGGSQASVEPLSPLMKAYIDEQVENAIKQHDESQTKGKKWRNSWRSASPITKGSFYITSFIAGATIAYALIAWGQFRAMQRIANDNSKQAEELIDAATQMKNAGWVFSGAAQGINNAGWNAVGRLQDQADKMEAARKSSEANSQKSLDAAIGQFRQEERAWVGVQSVTCGNCPKAGGRGETLDINGTKILIMNTGRTPALHVDVEIATAYMKLKDPIPDVATEMKNAEKRQPLIISSVNPDDREIAKLLFNLEQQEFTLSPNVPLPMALGIVPIYSLGPTDFGVNRPIWYVIGRITYFDAMSKTAHHTTFCALVNDQFPVDRPVEFHFCQTGNSMD